MCIWNQVISTRKKILRQPPCPNLPFTSSASCFPLSYQEESAAVAEVKDTSPAGRAAGFLLKEVPSINPQCGPHACPAPSHPALSTALWGSLDPGLLETTHVPLELGPPSSGKAAAVWPGSLGVQSAGLTEPTPTSLATVSQKSGLSALSRHSGDAPPLFTEATARLSSHVTFVLGAHLHPGKESRGTGDNEPSQDVRPPHGSKGEFVQLGTPTAVCSLPPLRLEQTSLQGLLLPDAWPGHISYPL